MNIQLVKCGFDHDGADEVYSIKFQRGDDPEDYHLGSTVIPPGTTDDAKLLLETLACAVQGGLELLQMSPEQLSELRRKCGFKE